MSTKKIDYKKIISRYGIYFIAVIIFLISAVASPSFCTSKNLISVLRQISVLTLLACAETVLIICGQIDLAAGAGLSLAGIFSIPVYLATGSIGIAIIAAMIIGMGCSLISGLCVTYLGLPAFIATLAMQMIMQGIVLLYTGGMPITQVGNFAVFGQGMLGSVPYPVLVMAVAIIILWIILGKTTFGRYMYAFGGNKEAARASGINIKKISMFAFAFAGAFIGLAGIMMMSRLNAGIPTAGDGYETDAIAAAVIGGASLSGGIGTAQGTLCGAIITGIISNILNLLGIQSYVQTIIKGLIIIGALALDVKSRGKKN